MLPLNVVASSVYYRPYTRMLFLTGDSKWGSTEIHSEHLLERLNSFVGNLSNNIPYDFHASIASVPFPEMSRDRVNDFGIKSDLVLHDVNRQGLGISERYHKGLTRMRDLRRIADPATKYHLSISNGFERDLVNRINDMDEEYLNRKHIQPTISI